MADVTAVFYIEPRFYPHETEMGYFMIDAAVSLGGGAFKHFVCSSVLDSQLRKPYQSRLQALR